MSISVLPADSASTLASGGADTTALFRSLVEQRDLLREGRLSSHDLTACYVARIRQLNGNWNIVIRENFAAALQRARMLADTLRRTGQPVGPLHGVPFTLKDAFRVARFGTSHGFPGVAALRPATSCTVVERLLAAGGVFLGHTNVPFACFDWQTNSPLHGLTRNPLDERRTVGGSSGGAAASVAACFSPFEVGGDVAGSIRYPAHCCGVYGLRPTHGWVPFTDVGPSFQPALMPNLVVGGPMARSLPDLELVLSVLTAEAVPAAAAEPVPLRLGFTLQWAGIAPDAPSRRTIDGLLAQLRQQGHALTEVAPPVDFDDALRVYGHVLGYEFRQLMPRPLHFSPLLQLFNHFFNTNRFAGGLFSEAFGEGLLGTRRRYEQALERAEALRQDFFHQLQPFDLWLTPAAATAAIVHQQTGTWQQLHGQRVPYTDYVGNFLVPTTLFHHPILTAPVKAAPADFPIGVQLHGKPGADWQLLAHCRQLAPLFAPAAPHTQSIVCHRDPRGTGLGQ